MSGLMGAKSNSGNGPSDMGGEELIKPGQEPGSRGISKLPPIPANIGGADTRGELDKEWVEYMVHGFKNNEEMFQRTLRAFMKPYHLTIWMYAALFVVGIALFVLAGIPENPGYPVSSRAAAPFNGGTAAKRCPPIHSDGLGAFARDGCSRWSSPAAVARTLGVLKAHPQKGDSHVNP